jgi:hypothetical protein
MGLSIFLPRILDGTDQIYILKVEIIRTHPGYYSQIKEFFVTKNCIEEKIRSFALSGNITYYDWDTNTNVWERING